MLLFSSLIVRDYSILTIGFIILFITFFDNIILPSFLHSYSGRSSIATLISFISVYSANSILQFLLVISVIIVCLPLGKSYQFKIRHFLMVASLLFVASVIITIIIQLTENQSYSLFTFILSFTTDFVVSSLIIIILILKFSSWLMANKNLFELLYIISFSMFFLMLISANIGLIQELGARYSHITPVPNPWDRMSTLKPALYDVYRLGFITSFAFIWMATSLFLKNYLTSYSRKKIEKWKYWILATIPLLYFIITSDFIINNALNLLIFQYPNFSNLIFYFLGSVKQVGGFFFALPFFFMAKNSDNTNLKYFLIISGIGIMILYSSIQISILHISPYPPFGLITLSTLPISSYLVLIGLYYSAKSISFDKKLLQNLKKQIKNESYSFLNAIGSAEWNKNLQVTVHKVLTQVKDKEDSISNLEEEDIRSYVVNVIKELKKEG